MKQDPAYPPGVEAEPKVWTEGQFAWLRSQHRAHVLVLETERNRLMAQRDGLLDQADAARKELGRHRANPWRTAFRITWRKLLGQP